MNQNESSYLMRGVRAVSTESSVLVSSSKYLNEPRLRDWIATHMLRRSGADRPTPAEAFELSEILRGLVDYDQVEWLFEAERRVNPPLDAWLRERHMSTFTTDDLLTYPDGSLARLFHETIVSSGYEIELVTAPDSAPERDFDYFMLRAGQTHDFEHLVTGGGLDFLGELVPAYCRLVNLFEHIRNPELAGELCIHGYLLATRIVSRAMLHYPAVWTTVIEAVERGIRVGRGAGPIFMARYEDLFHLPLTEARDALGIVGAEDIDTSAQTAIYEERVAV